MILIYMSRVPWGNCALCTAPHPSISFFFSPLLLGLTALLDFCITIYMQAFLPFQIIRSHPIHDFLSDHEKLSWGLYPFSR